MFTYEHRDDGQPLEAPFFGIQEEDPRSAGDAEIREAIRSCLQNGPLNKTSLVNAAKSVCSADRDWVNYKIDRVLDAGLLTMNIRARNAKFITIAD